ncbi:hypothetical protein MNV49_004849 [Pseudohyphozyma bogoriensis]|nr:hypothetical protein MNV49_004849 [Pseudohyphozyma bogoriensis]
MAPTQLAAYKLELASSPLDLVPSDPSSSSQLAPSSPLTSHTTSTNPDLIARSSGAAAVYGAAPAVEHHWQRRATLAPDDTQKVTLGVIGAYVVVIAVLWCVPIVNLGLRTVGRAQNADLACLGLVVKHVLYPFKMLTIAFHEFGHASTGLCTGASVKSISLDPREGGVTMMAGGISAITLPAGYLGSSFIGALLIFCGFDTVASKVASLVLGVCFLLTLWWGRKDWLTIVTILLSVGLIVAFWFIDHAAPLRWLVLFIGVMSALYSVWDIFDDLILRKVNESDASVFAKRYGGSSACWGVIWALVSILFMALGIIAGLGVFKESFSEQAAASTHFIPTV